MTKKMKNIDIVKALNNLIAFVERQREAKTCLLSVSGQFAIKANESVLMGKYEPYKATLDELKNKDSELDEKEVQDLFNIEVEVDLRTISESDFKDGCTIDDILLLDFMTE